jgi:Tol biopolymer transport system component
MTTQAATQKAETRSKRRRSLLLGLGVGVALAGAVALSGTAQQAEAAAPEKIVFVSERTTGKGVSNPTGDAEIFRMNPNGTGVRQLTFNQADEFRPFLSPDGQKIAYMSRGAQPSNPEGDDEIYVMNASDGSGQKNLTDNSAVLDDLFPQFSPDGTKISYQSEGIQDSNPQGDSEVYVMNASDGSGKTNLSKNGPYVEDYSARFSPDGQKVAYTSIGDSEYNPEGDADIYIVNADGSNQRNLTNNAGPVSDQTPVFSPDGQKIVYTSSGEQASNPEGDDEVYVMNSDGNKRKNLTNNGLDADGFGANDWTHYAEFSADGQKILYASHGVQTSNPEGDFEIYAMNLSDGTAKKNLTDNGPGVDEWHGVFSPDGQTILYSSQGAQASNPEGEAELYLMNAPDGSAKKNLTNNTARDFYAEWGR